MSGIIEDDFLAARLYDPAVKLFGSTIPVSSDRKNGSGGHEFRRASTDLSSTQHVNEIIPTSEDENSVPDKLGISGSNDGCDEEKMDGSPGLDLEHPVLPEADATTDAMQADVCCPNNEQLGREDRTLDQASKRPEKPINCPRCKSLDTKFCYFNNYNVNQPRHFCKNCQRYWTAGGTLRNVPVGAGRRKNKHLGAQAQSMLPDVVMVRSDPPDNAQHVLSPNPALLLSGQDNGHMKKGLPPSDPRRARPQSVPALSSLECSPSSAVLRFGQESPICVSTGTTPFTPSRPEVLQGYQPDMSQARDKRNTSMNFSPSAIGAQLKQNATDERNHSEQNASIAANESSASFLNPVAKLPLAENTAECSSPVASTPIKPEAGTVSEVPKYVDAALAWASSAPFSFMGGPWPYGASLGWTNALPAMALANAAQGGFVNPMPPSGNLAQNASILAAGANPAQTGGQPPWAAAMSPSWAGGIPWPLMQNPLWGPPGWGGAWTMAWAAPFMAAAAAAAVAAAAGAAAAAGPDLRSTILGKHPREQGEAEFKKVLVPKTLRIDDPGDAVRSSIWSTLGLSLGSDKSGAGGIFRDCSKLKADNRERDDPHASARSSNPAGYDRSASFQENMVASSMLDQGKEK